MRVEALRHDYEQQLKALRDEHDERIAQVRDEEGKRADALRAEHEELIAALRAKHAESIAAVSPSGCEGRACRRWGRAGASRCGARRIRTAFGSLATEHEAQLEGVRSGEGKRVAEARAGIEKRFSTLLAEQERRISSLEQEAAGSEAEMILKEAKLLRDSEIPRAYFVFENSGKAAASDFKFRLEFVLPDQWGRIENTASEVVAPGHPIGIPFNLAFMLDRKPDERMFLQLFVDYKDERTGIGKARRFAFVGGLVNPGKA
jgi:hypothetical protein